MLLVQQQKSNMQKLAIEFYQRDDVLKISRELMGKIVVTRWNGKLTSGRIVECEAYAGPKDKASHAFGGRRTNRTEVMYGPGGVAYVYLCYGIHQMFNVVTNQINIPNAILIRALEPITGIDMMLARSKKNIHGFDLTRGPGNVAKALGLHTSNTGMSLLSHELFIADDGIRYREDEIVATTRIGVDYAAEDALLP